MSSYMRGSCSDAPVCHSSYLSSMYRDLLAFALYFNFNLLNMTVIEDTEDFFFKKILMFCDCRFCLFLHGGASLLIILNWHANKCQMMGLYILDSHTQSLKDQNQ